VGNHEFLMTCACSAGPAFEGGGIEFGMRAARGAIDHVDIDARTGRPAFRTIGDAPPRGICGSGMISLLAAFHESGIIDAAGKFRPDAAPGFIGASGRQRRFTLVPASQSPGKKAIYISESDIDNIIRAKAAIYSACALMLSQLGMRFGDLGRIYIAGGFGRFLDIEKAIAIGLLPDVPRGKYAYIGNASLRGSHRLLVSREARRLQKELARKMTYIDLSNDPGYMDQYTAALLLPHTDLERFPSVKNRSSGAAAAVKGIFTENKTGRGSQEPGYGHEKSS
jgi:uncharacterized 2Fe-2S/4Fe-4S cluster protein (DUF4445 family)